MRHAYQANRTSMVFEIPSKILLTTGDLKSRQEKKKKTVWNTRNKQKYHRQEENGSWNGNDQL